MILCLAPILEAPFNWVLRALEVDMHSLKWVGEWKFRPIFWKESGLKKKVRRHIFKLVAFLVSSWVSLKRRPGWERKAGISLKPPSCSLFDRYMTFKLINKFKRLLVEFPVWYAFVIMPPARIKRFDDFDGLIRNERMICCGEFYGNIVGCTITHRRAALKGGRVKSSPIGVGPACWAGASARWAVLKSVDWPVTAQKT